jgi:repressor LexA
MEPLTTKQRMMLDYIVKRLDDGKPPSQREMAARFDMAQNSVYQLVNYLKKKGYVEDAGGHRGLRLTRRYARQICKPAGVPVVGRVAAGMPILAEENIEGYLDLPSMFKHARGVFSLQVMGDSMVDEGILDGDYVMVKPCADIESGTIAVVLIDDEATVKRVYKQKNRMVLKSANKKAGYKPIYVSATENLHVVGQVVGCVRTSVY